MADYYPLIARAVAGLDKNTGENRRALYGRARTALEAQLRGVTPPLDESEITRERLALEEAIRKVEAESARHAREARPVMIRRERPRREPAPPQEEMPARTEEPAREEAPLRKDISPPPNPQQPATVAARYEATSTPSPVHAATPAEAPAVPTPSAPRSRPAPPADEASAAGTGESAAQRSGDGLRRSLSDEALRGYRGVMGDNRPAAEARGPEDFKTGTPPPSLPPAPTIPPPQPTVAESQVAQGAPPEELWASTFESRSPRVPVDLDRVGTRIAHSPQVAVEESGPPAMPSSPRPKRSYSGLVKVVLVLVLLGAVGGAAYWKRNTLGLLAAKIAVLVKPSQPVRETTTTPPARPKIADRIEQPTQQPSAGLPVAQRVVLYEEDPNDAQGKRYVGTVLWRTEMKPATPGRPPELAIRGDIEVPERKMAMTWTLRRNTDPSLPASHTIEIMFQLPEGSPVGGVQNVPGVLMKQAEQTRGVPLAGLAVKVTPGYFLIGLSSVESDKQRNIQLLKERAWFDIPIVYNSNGRAILAMEKGTPGERVFAEAFAAWKE